MIRKTLKYFLVFGSITLVIWGTKKIIENYRPDPLCKNCDVLLISIDTLSAKHLSCYGYNKDTAPNLCQFGKDNILFSNSYSASHWTRPSQTSVFTGLHISTHNVIVTYKDKLDPKYKTIQEILKQNNYKTYYYGPPLDQGSWDVSVYGKGFDVNESQNYDRNSIKQWNTALDTFEQNKKNKQSTFMFLHTYATHDPYLPGDNASEFKLIDPKNEKNNPNIPIKGSELNVFTNDFKNYVLKSLRQRIAAANNTDASNKIVAKMLTSLESAKTLAESKKAFISFPDDEQGSYYYEWYFQMLRSVKPNDYVESLYDEKIYQLDENLKPIFERINNKFSKDTIVIIYSDHGETLGERGSLSHCDIYPDCLYNETIRVPLIIKIPGVKSKQISEVVQGIDIYPTILKLLGIKIPVYIEGTSLTDVIKNGKKVHDYVVSEQGDQQKAIMDKKWKAYFKDYKNITSDNVELYDLKNDLYEQKNLAKERPDIIKIKTDQLNEFVNKSKSINHPTNSFPDWIDNVKREKLIKEGYF